jgi:hypothetical protein
MRAPSFLGLRDDKDPKEVVREIRTPLSEILNLIFLVPNTDRIALLLADRLSAEQRKAVGSTLVLVGLVTTIPAFWAVLGKCGEIG